MDRKPIMKKIGGWLEGQKTKQMVGWMDRKDRWMVGCIVKKIDGWVEGLIQNKWMVGRV